MTAAVARPRRSVGAGLAGFVARCRFPEPADGPVALAVSGGPDSMALMALAGEAGLQGCAYHVDHGLRPGSAEEAGVVAAAAHALGFDFEARRVEIDPAPDLEARARRARYAALPAGVLTGHTMDDQAETVLLNLLRGAALDGLAGMRDPSGSRVRRPLLGLRRSETVEVCRRAGLSPVVDPSNQDPRFRRNRVRAELLPLLAAVAERDVVPVLARQAELAGEEAAFLDSLASALDPTDSRALRAAPPVLARRAIRAWLRAGDPSGEAHPPGRADVARVMDVVSGRHRACQIAGGRTVARTGGRLRIEEGISRW